MAKLRHDINRLHLFSRSFDVALFLSKDMLFASIWSAIVHDEEFQYSKKRKNSLFQLIQLIWNKRYAREQVFIHWNAKIAYFTCIFLFFLLLFLIIYVFFNFCFFFFFFSTRCFPERFIHFYCFIFSQLSIHDKCDFK